MLRYSKYIWALKRGQKFNDSIHTLLRISKWNTLYQICFVIFTGFQVLSSYGKFIHGTTIEIDADLFWKGLRSKNKPKKSFQTWLKTKFTTEGFYFWFGDIFGSFFARCTKSYVSYKSNLITFNSSFNRQKRQKNALALDIFRRDFEMLL